jgi:hypothetical protein
MHPVLSSQPSVEGIERPEKFIPGYQTKRIPIKIEGYLDFLYVFTDYISVTV